MEYEAIFSVEDNYWWHVGLRNLIQLTMDKYCSGNDNILILDAGCGTGGLIYALKNTFVVEGLEYNYEGIKYCKERDINRVVVASITDIPYKKDTFDIVISLDVLCQLPAGQDSKALNEIFRILKQNGLLILNLPANNFLRGRQDNNMLVFQRYTKKGFLKAISFTPFVINKITYRNTILFPVALIIKFIEKFRLQSDDEKSMDLKPLSRPLNYILTRILYYENILLTRMNFPYGVSLYIVAEKNEILIKNRQSPND